MDALKTLTHNIQCTCNVPFTCILNSVTSESVQLMACTQLNTRAAKSQKNNSGEEKKILAKETILFYQAFSVYHLDGI